MDFFKNCTTQSEREARYKQLARDYHPDHARDKEAAHEIMVEIQKQYRAQPESQSAQPNASGGPFVFDSKEAWAEGVKMFVSELGKLIGQPKPQRTQSAQRRRATRGTKKGRV